MGLISRVSSRTYRKISKFLKKSVKNYKQKKKFTAMSQNSQNLPNLTRNLSIGDNSENEMITDENQPPISQNMSTSKSKPKKRKKKKTTQVLLPEDTNRDILGMRGEMKDGGTLKEVRLVDFMSHKNFVFPGKNEKLKAISFICGPN